MNLFISLSAILALASVGVNGQETFIAPQVVSPGSTNPASVMNIGGSGVSFRKVLEKNKVAKWTQTIGNIPVYGSVLTTHNDDIGSITQIQGFLPQAQSISSVDTTPQLNGAAATETLKVEWNHKTAEELLTFRIDTPELQILQTNDGSYKLVWKVGYFVDRKDSTAQTTGMGKTPAYIVGLINARTGVIERAWDNLQHYTIWGILGNDKIRSSYKRMDVDRISHWNCKHRDASRRVEVFDIWDKREVTSSTTSTFQCDRASRWDWDLYSRTKGYSPRNEAFVHATRFVDMWTELIGTEIKPYRTDTSFLRFYTHYDLGYENAFFDGDSFKFGDGKNTFYPLTSLDIVCHEIGHAITQWKGGSLEYRFQSGGMNEAYSDILGETCDIHYSKKTDGLIAEDIMRPGSWLGESMRNMCEPAQADAPALDHFSQYTDNIGVHYSSGIYNKAWCTLKNTSGWDYIKAFEVFTDANLLYWNPTSTMHCGACGVESAAADRGYSKADVAAAFNVVGVSCRSCR